MLTPAQKPRGLARMIFIACSKSVSNDDATTPSIRYHNTQPASRIDEAVHDQCHIRQRPSSIRPIGWVGSRFVVGPSSRVLSPAGSNALRELYRCQLALAGRTPSTFSRHLRLLPLVAGFGRRNGGWRGKPAVARLVGSAIGRLLSRRGHTSGVRRATTDNLRVRHSDRSVPRFADSFPSGSILQTV